jgi:hypothetical protein
MPVFGTGSKRQLKIITAAETGTSDSTFPAPFPTSSFTPDFVNDSRTDGRDILIFNDLGNPINKTIQKFNKTGPTGWLWSGIGRALAQKTWYVETGSGISNVNVASIFTNHGIYRLPDLSRPTGNFTDLCGIEDLVPVGSLTRGDITHPAGFDGIGGFKPSPQTGAYWASNTNGDCNWTSGYPNDRAGSHISWIKPSIFTVGLSQDILTKWNTISYAEYKSILYGLSVLIAESKTDASAYIGRIGPHGMSINNWYMYTGCYSGGKNNASNKCYINSSQIDNANFAYSSYSGMVDTSQLHLGTGFAFTSPFSGLISLTLLFKNTDISATSGLIKSWNDWTTNPAGQLTTIHTMPIVSNVTGCGSVVSPWTIRGTGFKPGAPDASVTVAGVACTILNCTDTTITCVKGGGTPLGPQTMIVTNSDTETESVTITISNYIPSFFNFITMNLL